MLNKFAMMLLVVALLAAGPVWADSLTITFVNGGNANTNIGHSHTFTATSLGGVTGSATVYAWGGLPTETSNQSIYAKSAVGDEIGLGVVGGGGSINEIAGTDWLQMDVQDLVNKGFTSGTVEFGSVQAGETWAIWGSNTFGTLCTNALNCYSGNKWLATGGSTTDLTPEVLAGLGTYRYIDFTAPAGSVLLLNTAVFTTPEPSILSLLILGLVGVGVIYLRKMPKASLV